LKLIKDQLRTSNKRLQLVAVGMLAGIGILLGTLWYVQVVSAEHYENSQKNQSFRTVRLPAIRGKILDRNGVALAENRPNFHVAIYLEELRPLFTARYWELRREYFQEHPQKSMSSKLRGELERQARYQVASNIAFQVSSTLGNPLVLREEVFLTHYQQKRSLPMPVMEELTREQIALFVERAAHLPGVDLEVQPLRTYPQGELAAHVVGHVRMSNEREEDEEYYFKYRLSDFVGKIGVEKAFDNYLRGRSGRKSILVNHDSYRESEQVWPEPEPGNDVVLTLDIGLQRVAEQSLMAAGPATRGAAVVMDVRNGDILAMASAPSFDPNLFVTGMTREQWNELDDPELAPLFDRAAKGTYPPGSILKMMVGLAGLEAGIIDPRQGIYSPGFFADEKLLGRRNIKDEQAPAGYYDFQKATKRSSNTYFIHYGLRFIGPEKLIEMGNRFQLGQPTGIVTRQEYRGYFPKNANRKKDGMPWRNGDTANLCLGQGEVEVTPLQMAVMTAALANGGKILRPRLVSRVEPHQKFFGEELQSFPAEILREFQIHPLHLDVIHRGMLAVVEDPDGTGSRARVRGMRICGKTGTAQLHQYRNGQRYTDHIAWFISFAPHENPRYAVVTVVESGRSGGMAAAPVAQRIYQAIQNREPGISGSDGRFVMRN
jgi:penicillin-binding protein 2